MAITTEQQNQIAALTVGMLGVAPGKDYLDDLSGVYESNGGIAGVADYLVTTDQFNSFYADTETQAEKINQALDTLGFEATGDAREAAFAHFNGRVEQGYSDQAILLEAAEYLFVGDVDDAYADVSVQFQNRAEVASYYSIEKGLSSDDLDVLQGVVAEVTADPASVEAVKEAIDNGEIGVDNGASSDLTEALTDLASAEAGVTAALASAAETVNASEDTPLEGDALDTYVEQFDADQLETAITDAETAIDDANADVNNAQAALLTAQAQTFTGATNSAQGSGVSAAASALITADIVDGTDRLTDANIAQALKDAQAEVNADKTQYVELTSAAAVSASGSAGDIVKIVEIYASGTASVGEVPSGGVSAGVETAFAVAGTDSGFYDLEGNAFTASSSALTSAASSIAKSDMTTAKALQTALITAESAVASDKSANGSDVELLTDLRSAITDYADNGGDLSASAATGSALSSILTSVNTVLNNEDADAQASAAEALVSGFGDLSAAASGGYAAKYDGLDEDDSTFDAINAAIDAIENRDQLVEEAGVAETDFGATDTGANLGHANTLDDARDELSGNVTDAEDTLEAAEQTQTDLTTAQDDFNAATSDLEEAQQYFEDNDLELPVTLDGGVTATAENDIFLFNGEEATVGGFGLEGDDQLFIGTDFTLSAIESSVDVAGERTGDAGVLEVFAQQNGNNTVLTFENETFAGNAENGDDLTQVTLTGVSTDDLSLNADGILTIA